MSTDFAKAPVERRHPLATRRRTSRTRPPRVLVIDADGQIAQLLGDIFAGDYELVVPVGRVTIAEIDTIGPDVIVVGAVDAASRANLAPDEVVVLARRHMRLHSVPIVILSVCANVLDDAERLAGVAGVTVVSMPFELETIQSVMKSIARRGLAMASA